MKQHTLLRNLVLTALFLVFLSACSKPAGEESLSLDYEKYTLENGLDVILHQDSSDPIVAVAIQYHVGSNREQPGKTGFAHLFEHMMFQESENVAQDQFFKKIQSAGGTLNGGTSYDGTTYFEVVPKNAAEMVLWLESDRMGYLINTVTQSAFANQQDVVLNEKRQGVDNNPYGHNTYVINKSLFPEGHPYSWTVIGEMEDLFNATVADVKEFHGQFYVPNNATLVIAGDFEPAEMEPLVEKYFGEIPSGGKVTDMEPMPVSLAGSKRLYHEDNFARTPLLTMVWPTVELYTPDAYALDFLAEILGSGRKAPFYKVLVKEKQLTPRIRMYNNSRELTGIFQLSIPANEGTSLADVEAAVFESFQRFEEEGITETDLEKIKAGLETDFYNSISSVLGKSFQLAQYNEYAGEPGFITNDIANIKAVTIEDIHRVYNTYIKDKPFVLTSFVPKGRLDLAANDCEKAGVVEENVENALKVAKVEAAEEEIEKTPSSFDRSVQPPLGPDPVVSAPAVWESSLENGMNILGIESHEVPLVTYTIEMEGGHFVDPVEKSGTANLLSTLLMEGTANKTPEELEEAIDLLGANISIRADLESIAIRVNCLARTLAPTVELIREILLEPRWDPEEFDIAKMKVVNNLKRDAANADYLARRAAENILFGKGNLLSIPTTGNVETVENIDLEDLKSYYDSYLSPAVATLLIAGDVDKATVETAFDPLVRAWASKPVEIIRPALPEQGAEPGIYFVDFPGAKQSVILIGNLYSPADYFDYYASTVANYKLGGSFNGFLNMILREEKGFTYGARSGFSLNNTYGTFSASSSVRSDATLESVQIFHDEMAKYREGISAEDLTFTKDALLKSNARDYETLNALLGILSVMESYDLDAGFLARDQEILRTMDAEEHHALVQKYIDPEDMVYVVVGDAATQLKPLASLGLGQPTLVTVD
ncbi:MAG: pitrilysin family protein [Bacteroidales bacterium]